MSNELDLQPAWLDRIANRNRDFTESKFEVLPWPPSGAASRSIHPPRLPARLAITRRSVGISSATPFSQFAIIKVEEKRDQGECTLSQHRGLQVRHGLLSYAAHAGHGLLSYAAHADGAAEARAGLQAHGGRRRDRRRRAWDASDLYRYGSSLFRLDRYLSNRIRSARAVDPCRHPQLHRHPTHHSDQ